MYRILLKLLCFAVCFSLAGWFCRKQTDGFTLLKISSDLSYHAEWATPPLESKEKAEIQGIFHQPFTYLAKGDQCFVFESQDKQYVLKFFRLNHLRAPFWTRLFSSLVKGKEAKLEEDFSSYKLTFDLLKEETGLVFLHLNKTRDLGSTATIIDKLGIAHQIPLDSMEFLVQRRAEPLYSALEKQIGKKEIDTAKSTLTHLVHLLMSMRYEKGILDDDPDLNTNFGCMGDTPIQIDIGRFKRSELRKNREDYQKEIAHVTDNLHQWLECRSPVLDEHLKEEIAHLVEWGP